jgi:hypothetical protein
MSNRLTGQGAYPSPDSRPLLGVIMSAGRTASNQKSHCQHRNQPFSHSQSSLGDIIVNAPVKPDIGTFNLKCLFRRLFNGFGLQLFWSHYSLVILRLLTLVFFVMSCPGANFLP